ncbi:MAG TPA: hypothetical protein VHV08_01165, partial [Pirellulales bacterium]|nr:hypothetical protein [Pirellulales bacterium]
MDTIQLAVQAYILSLTPQPQNASQDQRPANNPPPQRLQLLADGKAVPSLWTEPQIKSAFVIANQVWSQASIEFVPITISTRCDAVPADEDGMWIYFINHLSPRAGLAVGFVYDLPSDEGGWGGGRIAIVGGAKAKNALENYAGSVLAHELGHVLFNSPEHDPSASNVMYGKRNPRIANADRMDQAQIEKAR